MGGQWREKRVESGVRYADRAESGVRYADRVVSGFAGEIRKKFADANFNYTFLTPNSSFLTNPKLYVFYSRCCVYVLL